MSFVSEIPAPVSRGPALAFVALLLVGGAAWGMVHDEPHRNSSHAIVGVSFLVAAFLLRTLDSDSSHRRTVAVLVMGSAAVWCVFWAAFAAIFRLFVGAEVAVTDLLVWFGPFYGIGTGAAMGYLSLRVYGRWAADWKSVARVVAGGGAAFVIALMIAEPLANGWLLGDEYIMYLILALVAPIPAALVAIVSARPIRWLFFKMGATDWPGKRLNSL
jgi:hypothetical protein